MSLNLHHRRALKSLKAAHKQTKKRSKKTSQAVKTTAEAQGQVSQGTGSHRSRRLVQNSGYQKTKVQIPDVQNKDKLGLLSALGSAFQSLPKYAGARLPYCSFCKGHTKSRASVNSASRNHFLIKISVFWVVTELRQVLDGCPPTNSCTRGSGAQIFVPIETYYH